MLDFNYYYKVMRNIHCIAKLHTFEKYGYIDRHIIKGKQIFIGLFYCHYKKASHLTVTAVASWT